MSYAQKLEQHKQKHLELEEKRKQEIISLVSKLDLLTLPNDLIVGSLITAINAYKDNDKTLLERFQQQADKSFRRRSKQNNKSDSDQPKAS